MTGHRKITNESIDESTDEAATNMRDKE